MSSKAEAVLEAFNTLPQEERYAVAQVVAQTLVPDEYGELSDEELTLVAAQSFALLDEEENRAATR